MYNYIALLAALAVNTLAIAEPMVTAAAQLAPRQAVDPAFVGYISANGAYTDGRTCDFPQTISTSGSYVQCCPTTGSCAFFTSCSSNTLVGPSDTVPCDVNSALTCNIAIVLATPSAGNRGSYLACWQKTLGTGAFTFVQDTQGASGATRTSGGSATSGTISSLSTLGTGGSTATQTGSSGGTSATAASASSSRNAAATDENSLSKGGVIGLLALLAQALV